MRLFLLSLVVLTGCALPRTTTTTVSTQRLLMAPTPVAPVALSGGSGLALGLSLLPFSPSTVKADGAVAHATVQPELNGVLQVGHGTALSARFALATPSLGVQAQSSPVGLPADASAVDATIGVAHDFSAPERRWGLTVSGEAGASFNTLAVTTRSSGVSLTTLASPSFRAAAGLWVTLGPERADSLTPSRPVRLYGGLSGGTTMSNDASGTRTTTCTLTCGATETGVATWGAVIMVGGGARWQVLPLLSLGVEGWAVLQSSGASVPFVGAVTVRVGTFELTPAPPKTFTPMDPPAWEEVEPPPPAPPPV